LSLLASFITSHSFALARRGSSAPAPAASPPPMAARLERALRVVRLPVMRSWNTW
jgi:hypothetical protein